MTDITEPDLMTQLRTAAKDQIATLRASGAAPGLAVGDTAPDFTLPAATGPDVRLADRLTRGPVVISFYRGAWCPYCSTELQAHQAALPDLKDLGASLIAISPQAPDASLPLVHKHGLEFDVLSDLDQVVGAAYKVQFALTEDIQRIYPQIGLDLGAVNADGTWRLPVPATFVLDPRGVVRTAHVDPNYTERMTTSDLIDAVKALA